jgi:hypothetical protein
VLQLSAGCRGAGASALAGEGDRRRQLPRRRSASINSREPLSKRARQTLHVLQHALDVLARLGDRNTLDPVDRIDFWIARIAVLRDPVPGPAAADIVGNERQNVGAAVEIEVVAELGRAELGIVGGIVGQAALIVRDVETSPYRGRRLA